MKPQLNWQINTTINSLHWQANVVVFFVSASHMRRHKAVIYQTEMTQRRTLRLARRATLNELIN